MVVKTGHLQARLHGRPGQRSEASEYRNTVIKLGVTAAVVVRLREGVDVRCKALRVPQTEWLSVIDHCLGCAACASCMTGGDTGLCATGRERVDDYATAVATLWTRAWRRRGSRR